MLKAMITRNTVLYTFFQFLLYQRLSKEVNANIPCGDNVKSSFRVYTINEAKKHCLLHKKIMKSLQENGFTKVMCPFGILMVATPTYPDNLLRYGANMLAQMVDKNVDGQADNLSLLDSNLAHSGVSDKGAILVCGSTAGLESRYQNLQGIESTYPCNTHQGTGYPQYQNIMYNSVLKLYKDADPTFTIKKSDMTSAYTKKGGVIGATGFGSALCRDKRKFIDKNDSEQKCYWVKKKASSRCSSDPNAYDACKVSCQNCPCDDPEPPAQKCNGLESNCALRVNEVLFPTVHNANHDSGLFSNHNDPLEDALDAGYRGLLLDICSCENISGESYLKMCHGNCLFGSRDITEVFTNIVEFVKSNPEEVLIIDLELSVGTDDSTLTELWWNVLANIPGLKGMVYEHPSPTTPWPLMKTLIDESKQIILFQHNGPDCTKVSCPPKIHTYFQYVVETPWNLPDVSAVENVASSCKLDRGIGGRQDFYGVNNFVIGTWGPSWSAAQTLNDVDFILKRIKDCEAITKLRANFVIVDYWMSGDVVLATNQINASRKPSILVKRSRFLDWVYEFLGY